MRKLLIKIILVCAVCGALFFILNADSTSRQCIDFKCHSKHLPLGLKAIDFLDRHYNYSHLAAQITTDAGTDEERVLRILRWVSENLREQPKGMPVVDDHVWNIIVRGYALNDQYQDVFSTLCNYSGYPAFFDWITVDKNKGEVLSFVELHRGWSCFDASRGVYFRNKEGGVATVDELGRGDWEAVCIDTRPMLSYENVLARIKTIDFSSWRSRRSALQSPLNRILFMGNRSHYSRTINH